MLTSVVRTSSAASSVTTFSRSTTPSSSISRSPSPNQLVASNGHDWIMEIMVGEENKEYRESLSTLLLSEPESVLAMLARRQCCLPKEEQTKIELPERSSDLFQFILDFLRRGTLALLPSNVDQLRSLMHEAQCLEMYQMVAMLWCLVERVKLKKVNNLLPESEVVWNPGVRDLFWQGFAVMSRCYFTHKQGHLIVGFVRSKTNVQTGSEWWSYDLVCPSCQQFDFAPVPEDGVDFERIKAQTKRHMLEDKGVIVKIENETCALVDWKISGHKFHIPLKALLPVDYTKFILPPYGKSR